VANEAKLMIDMVPKRQRRPASSRVCTQKRKKEKEKKIKWMYVLAHTRHSPSIKPSMHTKKKKRKKKKRKWMYVSAHSILALHTVLRHTFIFFFFSFDMVKKAAIETKIHDPPPPSLPSLTHIHKHAPEVKEAAIAPEIRDSEGPEC